MRCMISNVKSIDKKKSTIPSVANMTRGLPSWGYFSFALAGSKKVMKTYVQERKSRKLAHTSLV